MKQQFGPLPAKLDVPLILATSFATGAKPNLERWARSLSQNSLFQEDSYEVVDWRPAIAVLDE